MSDKYNTRDLSDLQIQNNKDTFVSSTDSTPESEYVDISKPYQKNNGKKNKNKKKMNKGLKITLISLISVICVAAIGFVVWYFFFSSSSTFVENITVDNISISGMSMQEAQKALKKRENEIAGQINIEVDADKKNIKLNKDDFVYSFNTQKLLDDAMAYSEQKGFKTEEKKYTIEMKVDRSSCDTASKKASKTLNQKASNAKVTKFNTSDTDFTIQAEKFGIKVKEKELAEELIDLLNNKKYNTKINAPADKVKPKYTKAYLEENIKLVSEFTTESTNNENGNSNMATALEACNGLIIEPGKSFSFNDQTGDSNQTSNGYKEAGVIVNGKYSTGVGGGICQASTTIYNAALLAGMETIERNCHEFPSSYVDPGRDATIDYGNTDLVMKNVFDYQLMMKCYMDDVILHAEIYAVPNPDFDHIEIDTTSETRSNGDIYATGTRTFYKGDKKVKSDELFDSLYHKEGGADSDEPSLDRNTNDDDSDDDNKPTQAPKPVETKAPEPETTAEDDDDSDPTTTDQ